MILSPTVGSLCLCLVFPGSFAFFYLLEFFASFSSPFSFLRCLLSSSFSPFLVATSPPVAAPPLFVAACLFVFVDLSCACLVFVWRLLCCLSAPRVPSGGEAPSQLPTVCPLSREVYLGSDPFGASCFKLLIKLDKDSPATSLSYSSYTLLILGAGRRRGGGL